MIKISRTMLEWLVPSLEFWWVLLTVVAGIVGAGAAIVGLMFWWYGGALKTLKQEEDLQERQSLQLQIAKADARAAKANEKAEKERKERLELEKAVAPRSVGDQLQFAEQLKPFTGTQVFLESLVDAEASRLAGQVAFVLVQAGWRILSMQRMMDNAGFMDGVRVEANLRYKDEKGQMIQDDTEPAAKALVAELGERDIKVNRLPSVELPPHTIRVRVGLKPMTYFLSKGERDALEEAEKPVKEAEKGAQ